MYMFICICNASINVPNFFNQSWIDGHFGWFYNRALVNKQAVNKHAYTGISEDGSLDSFGCISRHGIL